MFFRVNANRANVVKTPAIFSAVESLSDRYVNVAKSGLQYASLYPRKEKRAPLSFNCRIYSCILINNSIPFRWRGRYNEDTDLSIRALKAGWCTILFNAFLAEKMATMRMSGGNTDELYKQNDKMDGRLLMAQSLKKQHPDITKIVWKWGGGSILSIFRDLGKTN